MIPTAQSDAETPIWSPSLDRIARANLTAFTEQARRVSGQRLATYAELHAWSVDEPAAFWSLIWETCEVIGDRGARSVVDNGGMLDVAFFPDARLNYAENLLRRHGSDDAIVFKGEDKVSRRLSWDQLHDRVSQLQQALIAANVKAGDRVAAILPNLPEAVAAMLATASLGAVWSSCSPDFGEQGIIDRLGQIEPSVLFAADGYWYNGKRIDISEKIAAVAARLGTVRKTIVFDYLGVAESCRAVNAETFAQVQAAFAPKALDFVRVPFAHPLCIVYSSGTTGIPKCIVHSTGGTLLQHLKEHRLHGDIKPGDRLFYFTTLGWMMWNWLVSGLASEATLLLYDGSPFAPSANVLFDYAEVEATTHFGTSAKFLDALRKSGLQPKTTHNLGALRALLSTGSPLSPDGYRFVYDSIKSDVHLASISGGTDILSCFVLGIPTEPVWPGEIQGPGLAMAVDVWDDDGRSVRGQKGELVCTRAFPSMPVMFWNDPGRAKYRSTYFGRFEGVWCHGDFAEWGRHGGLIIHGRSDATLNPGGVRIGTAEIYNQVEQLPEVLESVCIGQDFDNDVRIVLFVRLAVGVTLDAALEDTIRRKIRLGASPRHVPARIIAVDDIPRTKSGKITELAVRDVVHGRPVKNKEALANPEALSLFRNLPALAT
jgi:acetoacetyl-CoA synthetase